MIETRIGTWNVRSGGYDTYATTPTNPRMAAIQETVASMQADALVVSDAYGWDDETVRSTALQRYTATFFTPLDDSRLLQTTEHDMSHIGVAIGTNHPVAAHDSLDLLTRQGSSTILDIGQYGLRVASIYLDDLDEELRSRQVEAMLSQLQSEDIPTVIAGDFNAQRPTGEITAAERLRSRLVTFGADILARTHHPYAARLKDLEKRQALMPMAKASYINTDHTGKPTALYPHVPLFRVDHIYTNPRVVAAASKTLPKSSASDHRPIISDVILS